MTERDRVHLIDPSLAAALINAETIKEAEDAIRALERAIPGSSWRAVGDVKYNHGPAQIGIDPATQLIERVINAQEACIELEAQRQKKSPPTPQEAARQFFGVKKGGLAAMNDPEIRALAERTVSVTMCESGNKLPSIVIEDRGLGQHPSRFSSTLLGLHVSDKPSKPYLIGQYGQGGASTFVHCKYTIFVSRRAPDLLASGEDDLVGIAVVRFTPGEVRGGTYEYLTKNDAILGVRASEAPTPFNKSHGTRITHVAYNLHGYTSAYRQMKSGLWGLLNAALFDPVLPVHIKGKRKSDTRGDKGAMTTGRIAKGNAAILSGLPDKPRPDGAAPEGDGTDDDEDEAGEPADGNAPRRRRGNAYLALNDDPQTLLLDDGEQSYGSIRTNIWVLAGTENSETYVRADQAVTLTLAGQRHGKESREFLKSCKLGFLAKRMIVQIDADGLSAEAKRQAFPSGREQQRKTGIVELVFATLGAYLEKHERIRELEAEARAQELAKSSSKARDSVRKKVAKLMQRHLVGSGGALGRAMGAASLSTTGGPAGRTPGLRRPPQPRPPKPPPDDTALEPIPTRMEIANSQLTVEAGGTTHAVLYINAKNGYLADHGDELRVEIVPADDVGDESPLDATADAAKKSGDGPIGGGAGEGGGGGGTSSGDGPGSGAGTGGTGGGAGGGSQKGGHGITVRGMGSLRGGRARLVLGSDPNATPGEYTLRVRLPSGAGNVLVAEGTVEVVPAAAVAGGQELLEGGTPDIKWCEHPDDATTEERRKELASEWPSEWTDKNIVGDVFDSGDVFVFRLNASYPELKNAIARRSTSSKGSISSVEALKDKYAAMVSFGMWLLHEQKKKEVEKWPEDVFQGACSALARSTLATMIDSELEDDAG